MLPSGDPHRSERRYDQFLPGAARMSAWSARVVGDGGAVNGGQICRNWSRSNAGGSSVPGAACAASICNVELRIRRRCE